MRDTTVIDPSTELDLSTPPTNLSDDPIAPPDEQSTLDAASEPPVDGFAALALDPRLQAALVRLGYEEPTPIQKAAIPPLLAGRDVLGQAATGTGKTAAFALPILQHLSTAKGRTAPTSLVIVPTRELALQVAEALVQYGKELGVRVATVFGGQSMERQIVTLSRGVDVVVATPGRAHDLLRRNRLPLEQVRSVVLDEADEMLDMGFADDLEAILAAVPTTRQTALLSATMPRRIAAIAARHLRNPVNVKIEPDRDLSLEAPKVRQVAYRVVRAYKVAALARVLEMESPTATLVFCRTRAEVDSLAEEFGRLGMPGESLHGGLSQEQRTRVMTRLRTGASTLVIATDVAARGLDVDRLTHVINYDPPPAPEVYVHRIGRVGRAGRSGVAITLVEPRERNLLRSIEQLTKLPIRIADVPAAAALKAKRLEQTVAELRTLLHGEDGTAAPTIAPELSVAMASLAAEFEPAVLAAAALQLAHTTAGRMREVQELPAVTETRSAPFHSTTSRSERRPGERFGAGTAGRTSGAGYRGEGRSSYGASAGEGRGRPGGRPGDERSRPYGGGQRRDGGSPYGEGGNLRRPPANKSGVRTTHVVVDVGRDSGLRPGDLFGALANEIGVDPKAIGAIRVAERQSSVEVPADVAHQVAAALGNVYLKGKRAAARPGAAVTV
jgi:ATP-dependent RNA helicase DeaD